MPNVLLVWTPIRLYEEKHSYESLIKMSVITVMDWNRLPSERR